MSLTFPGLATANGGTQQADLPTLMNNMQTWAKNAHAITGGSAPTYKAINKPYAYFRFLNNEITGFSDGAVADFQGHADEIRYKEQRKYMCIFANIILCQYFGLKVGCRERDYKTLVNKNGNADLATLFGGWAEEIDPEHCDVLTEMYVQVQQLKMPIAFLSQVSTGLIVFPYNTINPSVRDLLIGWDDEANDFTMAKLKKDLAGCPTSERALYAAIKNLGPVVNGVLSALASWLCNNFDGVVTPMGMPYAVAFDHIPVDDSVRMIEVMPIPVPAISPEVNLFSEQLLIVSSNINVKNQEYGFCVLDNASLGLHHDTKIHAAVPPLSYEFIQMLHTGTTSDGMPHDVTFEGCSVVKSGPSYEVSITITVDGAVSVHKNSYFPRFVKMCDNFPLISLLNAGTNQVWLHRADYPADPDRVGGMQLDGRADIRLGNPNNANELGFGRVIGVFPDTFNYFSINYHDFTANIDYCLGYLFFDKVGDNSLFSLTSRAASRTMIIDEENDIAKIASFNIADPNPVSCHEVLNDHILLIDTNHRTDLDSQHCWGQMGVTIFQTGHRYILAPFSQEFARMVASGEVTINQAQLTPNGGELRFALRFMFGGKMMVTAPHVYSSEMQYLMLNPPFLRVLDNYNAKLGTNGFELVKIPNMGLTQDLRNQTRSYAPLDSNDLIYRLEGHELEDKLFIQDQNDPNQVAYIQIYEKGTLGDIYHGQISLTISQHKEPDGFSPLKDNVTNCHAIILIRNKGVNQPKEIITGRVFDDNLFLIAKEQARTGYAEYDAWRSSGFMVNINGMTDDQRGGKDYQAVFPFSLNLLRNLTDGTIMSTPGSLRVEYDQKQGVYKASVSIQETPAAAPKVFERSYAMGEVVKCDNLPFILSFADGSGNLWISRFNNESVAVTRNHIDGKTMTIEYVQPNAYPRLDENQTLVPVQGQNVILRLSAPNGDKQYSCHILYQADQPFTDGVWAVKSETGAQHVINFDAAQQSIQKIRVFTDYIMYSSVYEQTFAHETAAVIGPLRDYRIYSIPVTQEFTQLMEARGLAIQGYSNVVFYTDPSDKQGKIKSDTVPLHVEIMVTNLNGVGRLKNVYDPSHIASFADVPLPTLTVFPYVNFVAGTGFADNQLGKPIWNHYIFANIMLLSDTPKKRVQGGRDFPIGSRVDFYANGKRMIFNSRSTKANEARDEVNRTEMQLANVDGWATYIHMVYDGSNLEAVPLDIDRQLDRQEFGCIYMEKAERHEVDMTMTAKVGVDFGTRNSIIALQSPNDTTPSFPYHGPKELQQVIIPGMNIAKEFAEFTDLSYIPHFEGKAGPGCGKFASTVMTYSQVNNPNATVNPYDQGFVPNVKGRVLEELMKTMNRPGSMGSLLGYYTDLKVSTDSDNPDTQKLMDRNVRTFIKSIMFHTVLNCYQEGCAGIDIRFSVPSEAFARQLAPVWRQAVEYVSAFIPDTMANSIRVTGYTTEARALFEYLKNDLANDGETMSTYSAITDGGDGTYDFTINKYENNTLTNPAKFSLRYAGQEIMTDSVNTFYDHLIARHGRDEAHKLFLGMWRVASDSPEEKESKQQTLDSLVGRFENYKLQGARERQTEKALILMLVEQFGIDNEKLSLLVTAANGGKKLEINPSYMNFVGMIRYKFLFLFNVLGEQIRAHHIALDKQRDTSFNVYLYGGTAQALTIAEPYCRGDIKAFMTQRLPMAQFIEAMLDFPNNVNGAPIHVKFYPAINSEKKEIVSGLVSMNGGFSGINGANGAPIPQGNMTFDMGLGVDDTADDAQDDIAMDFGFGMDDVVTHPRGEKNGKVDCDSYCPKDVNELIEQLEEILTNRRVMLSQGGFNIDKFVLFQDVEKKTIKLSEILQKVVVREELESKLSNMWDVVCSQNVDVAKMANSNAGAAKLLHQIYLLKMVSLAIETYLSR